VRGKVKHMAHTSRQGVKDSGRSYYTNGHIMVIRGFTDAGNVIVNDPARGGKRRVIKAADFTKIWRGFTIDIKK
ncbi:C39 family peptidase, partial [bacterium]|nr:C39 family peptidase [bacterium]